MAEFCKQCAEELGFEPDFAGMIHPEDVAMGFGANILCEGCGPCLVDHTGKCMKGELCNHYDDYEY